MTVAFSLPPIYPITDTGVSGLTHAEQVRLLSAGGATVIQLRDKFLSGNEFYVEAKAALDVARNLGTKLIINDRVDVALAIGAHGVHLGQDDLNPHAARKLLGPHSIIGLSTHNLAQAVAAAGTPVDYIAIGPVFPTASKKDTSPVVGLAGVAEVRRFIERLPLVAIGGITLENAPEVFIQGASSVALISALLSNPTTITERTANLLQMLR
jgi:thiamine-phosphate pyrophosphorylase